MHESEARKQKQTVADRELELQDSIRDLEAKIISLEKAREKDRQTFQGKLVSNFVLNQLYPLRIKIKEENVKYSL